MKRRFLSLLSLLCLTAAAAGCGHSQSHPVSTPSQPGTTASSAAPTVTAPTQPARDRNPLTGQDDIVPGSGTRPVAVMIENSAQARPQVGLDAADLLFEAETEGGITRMMAVFANSSRIPDKLGPVRSARTHFALLAQALDAVYAHFGQSTAALAMINRYSIPHIDGLVYDGSTFIRDKGLAASRGSVHSVVTGGDKIAARMKAMNIKNDSSRKAPFLFGAKTGGGAGQQVQIFFSGAQTVSFRYDASSGLYTKSNGPLSNPTTHVTDQGVPLTFANVLLMYDEKYAENDTTISFRLQSGSGLLISGGTSRSIRWTRSGSQLAFTEADGSALQVAAGKSYIALLPKSNAGSTVVK